MKRQQGFSLVELAIVLVIIGLIVGGILTGQDLIRASELNSVTSDVNKLRTAVNTFKLKYNGLPGDIPNATSYWSGTANGSNDGRVLWAAASMRAWQHLGLSGLIPGSYSGVIGTGALPGTNIPESSLKPAGFGFYNMNYGGTSVAAEALRFLFGGFVSGTTNWAAVITPQDAASIDSKIDDGIARNGDVQGNTGSGASGTCITSTAYTLSNTGIACSMSFKYQ